MSNPIWVQLTAVYVIHDRRIARHGGASGLRDKTLLEAAVVRPENKFSQEQADMFACAAAYAFGIAKAHAFVDGNKRTAFVTAV
ncbi:MAG: type II toxin-antitoxin system death-on-curing family toxin, partial [Paracoccaceae bacterium]|nr:type II toxin-antitoxin system death-on-curing family toxin [Paracoccaceae bacterium]